MKRPGTASPFTPLTYEQKTISELSERDMGKLVMVRGYPRAVYAAPPANSDDPGEGKLTFAIEEGDHLLLCTRLDLADTVMSAAAVLGGVADLNRERSERMQITVYGKYTPRILSIESKIHGPYLEIHAMKTPDYRFLFEREESHMLTLERLLDDTG